jgi:hypothetical protein
MSLFALQKSNGAKSIRAALQFAKSGRQKNLCCVNSGQTVNFYILYMIICLP